MWCVMLAWCVLTLYWFDVSVCGVCFVLFGLVCDVSCRVVVWYVVTGVIVTLCVLLVCCILCVLGLVWCVV